MKKGQITLFIIIGILVLLLIGLSIYLWTTYETKEIEQAVLPEVQQIPSEIQPIRDYVSTCLQSIAKEAIIKIGDHGGYINSEKFSYNPIEPTQAEAVLFSPESDLAIPYWWYLESDNNCEGKCYFKSKRPELYGVGDSIENQMKKYIEDNLQRCVEKFEVFTEQGYNIIQDKNAEIDVKIPVKKVLVYADFPLTIKKGEKTFTIPDYSAIIDVNLKEIYDIGTEIANHQAEHRIFEKHTRQLIDLFSRIDNDALPPVSEIEIKYGAGTIWIKNNVLDKITQMLSSYARMLQAGGAGNYKMIKAPADARDAELYETIYNRGMILFLKKDYPELNVNFQYLDWWKPYFDLNCDGQVCKPESISSSFLGFIFGIQDYNFAYDISYPILTEITQPEAFGGTGYSFKFFLEANMRNNMPMPSEFSPLKEAKMPDKTMFCSPMQRNSANISIKVINGRTKQPVENADIAYGCGKEICSIGTTNIDGMLTTEFPICIDGIIVAEKLDYHPSYLVLETDKDEEKSIEIILEPYRFMDFEIKKWRLKKGTNWELDTSETTHQKSDEETLIMLTRETKDFEEKFTSFAEICGGNFKSQIPCGRPAKEFSKQIKMLPGKYKVQIYSFRYPQPPVEFPPDKRCIDTGFEVKCYHVPEESMIFDKESPYLTGMTEFEWEISAGELDKADIIEFYNFNLALDALPAKNRKIEDLDQIGQMKKYSIAYRNYLEPMLK